MHHQLATIGILTVARKPIFRPAELSVATDLAWAHGMGMYESETCSSFITNWPGELRMPNLQDTISTFY